MSAEIPETSQRVPVSIQIEPNALHPARLLETFTSQACGAGAVVSFTGMMREWATGNGSLAKGEPLEAMEMEHYPGMTEKTLSQLARQAIERWPLESVLVAHRVGRILPQDPIVFVAVASAHRAEAFEAAMFLMDYLKTRAPFWKKEVSRQGSAWVEAKTSDQERLERWER